MWEKQNRICDWYERKWNNGDTGVITASLDAQFLYKMEIAMLHLVDPWQHATRGFIKKE